MGADGQPFSATTSRDEFVVKKDSSSYRIQNSEVKSDGKFGFRFACNFSCKDSQPKSRRFKNRLCVRVVGRATKEASFQRLSNKTGEILTSVCKPCSSLVKIGALFMLIFLVLFVGKPTSETYLFRAATQ